MKRLSTYVNLTFCEREPIHVPGLIQAHGVLLVLRGSDFAISQVSANSEAILGMNPGEMLGQRLQPLLEEKSFRALNECAQTPKPGVASLLRITLKARPCEIFEGTLHRGDNHLILELEGNQPARATTSVHASFERLQNAATVEDVCQITTEEVRRLTGFDRVLIHRCAADGSSQVVAEVRDDNMASYLGTCVPAPAIPPRTCEVSHGELLIPDTGYSPTPVLGAEEGQPLHMSHCVLRSVSPRHLQLLHEMGVGAALTIPLTIDGQLWGIIACHHSTPWFRPFTLRQECQFLARVAAAQIDVRSTKARYVERTERKGIQARLLNQATGSSDVAKTLTESKPNLLDFVEATGAAVLCENRVTTVGNVPDDNTLINLRDWLSSSGHGSVFSTHRLASLYPPALAFESVASGLLVVQVLPEHGCYLLWFRPAIVSLRSSAGNSDESSDVGSGRESLGHYASRSPCEQAAMVPAQRWTDVEIAGAAELGQALAGPITGELERMRAMAERKNLLAALEASFARISRSDADLEQFAHVTAHDLQDPLRIVAGCTQLFERKYTGKLDEKAEALIRMIVESSSRMKALIDGLSAFLQSGRGGSLDLIDTGEVLEQVVADLSPAIRESGAEVAFDGLPRLRFVRRHFEEVLRNLLGNAIKFRNSVPPKIQVSAVHQDAAWIFRVADNGIGLEAPYLGSIFGVFKRLHTREQYPGTGIGLAIAERIIDSRGGRIWVESSLGSGSTFFFSIPDEEPQIADHGFSTREKIRVGRQGCLR